MHNKLLRQAVSYMSYLDECLCILTAIRESGDSEHTKETLISPIGLARKSMGEQALNELIKNNILSRNNGVYTLIIHEQELNDLCYLLNGMLLQKNTEKKDKVEIVLTLPRSPNSLEEAIKKQSLKSVKIQNTEDIFEHLAHKCKRSLTVMTPFFDKEGATFLVNLFKITPENIEKNLILRFLSLKPSESLYPKGFLDAREQLIGMGVKIYDYAIERPAPLHSLETFHSKTILSDSDLAYIGSSNINKSSLSNSMELGVLLSGEPVNILSLILESVKEISKRV